MTTQPLSLDDGLPIIPKRVPIVQIQELPLCSPMGENGEEFTHGVVEVVGKSSDGFINNSRFMLEGINLKRPYSGGHDRRSGSRPEVRRWSSSLGSPEGITTGHETSSIQVEVVAELRKTMSVDNAGSLAVRLGKNPSRSCDRGRDNTMNDHPSSSEQSAAPVSLLGPLPPRGWFSPSQLLGQVLNGPTGVVAPLTPPEDLDPFKWESLSQVQAVEGILTASSVEQSQSQGQNSSRNRTSSASRPSEIQMPEPSDMAAAGDSSTPNWLGRACQRLGRMIIENSRLGLS